MTEEPRLRRGLDRGVFAVDVGAGTVRRAVSAGAGVTGERNFVAGATGEYWAVGQSGEFFHGTP